MLVGQGRREQLVVGAEVVDGDPALRNAGRAAGLEDVDRLVGERLRHPAPDRPTAELFVFEMSELREVVEALDFLAGVPPGFLGPLEPERASRVGIEMPANHFADPGVEGIARRGGARLGLGHLCGHQLRILH